MYFERDGVPGGDKLQSDLVELKSQGLDYASTWLATSIGPGGIEIFAALHQGVAYAELQSDLVELKLCRSSTAYSFHYNFNRTWWN